MVSPGGYSSGDLDSLMHCVKLTREDALVRAAGDAAYRQYWQAPSDPAACSDAAVNLRRRDLPHAATSGRHCRIVGERPHDRAQSVGARPDRI